MKQINFEDMDDIALGASLLGAGGGGDPYIGKLMVMSAMKACGPVTLLSEDEIADDALVLPIGMMGAPTVLAEKGIGMNEVEDLMDMAVKTFGKRPDVLMCTEAGGVNSMMPLCAGSRLGIPVVDADGMGRAFPELQMETMSIGDIQASPALFADEKGNRIVFEAVSNRWIEEFARACTVKAGGNVCVCMFAMTGAQFKKYSVMGTISRCKELGSLIRRAAASDNKEDVFLKGAEAFKLFIGKISDVQRSTNGAFNLGQVIVNGIRDYKDRTAVVTFQNENLMCRIDDVIYATVPDLICIVDLETFRPITTDRLKYGKRVMIIGMPCNPLWRTPKGLELVGPRYFKIDTDYVPLEERIREAENV